MRIYLDHNATTAPRPEVIDLVTRVLRDTWGNASSVHAYGQQAKSVLDEARSRVATLIGADPAEVVLCGSGTESDNLAIRGAADAQADGAEWASRQWFLPRPADHPFQAIAEEFVQGPENVAHRGHFRTARPGREASIPVGKLYRH